MREKEKMGLLSVSKPSPRQVSSGREMTSSMLSVWFKFIPWGGLVFSLFASTVHEVVGYTALHRSRSGPPSVYTRGIHNDRRKSSGPSIAFSNVRSVVSSESESSLTVDVEHEKDDPVYPAIGIGHLERYRASHARSVAHNRAYWNDLGSRMLDWYVPFPRTDGEDATADEFDTTWFAGGKLNLCHNAVDRHVSTKETQTALIWEGDEPGVTRSFTYRELLREVSRVANALKAVGVRKGDKVTIYMPMIPEIVMTMLACTRIGAVHSIVFAGFSSEALAQRIEASGSRFVVTADKGLRGGKEIPLKQIVNRALETLEDPVEKVLVFRHDGLDDDDDGSSVTWEAHPNDVAMDPLVRAQRPYCPCETMDAEDELFILYTSGSTGNPKGLVHTTGGYALYAMHTTAQSFDLRPDDDVFACVADCGWITGHTYTVYGPLLNGGTTLIFESTPLYPDPGRYWDMVERHKISIFYTAPTAIRSLMRYGDSPPKKYDTSSLRILGSVGEPINPEAWRWYYEVVGEKKCSVVDTYWQTETGGHIITNLPGIVPMKPGSCTLPCYGIDPVLLDAQTGEELPSDGPCEGVLAIRKPWPGMARTCLGDHGRYSSVYLKPYPGYYFTGDSARRDSDGYFFITGRVDDVINVSGHRIGTAEVESALVAHPAVAQAAAVGYPHPLKGQGLACFATLTAERAAILNQRNDDDKEDPTTALEKELRGEVRTAIGPFASPDFVVLTPNLPMTRSGKIMRRILRKIVAGEADSLGDTSTLADPSVVGSLITMVAEKSGKKVAR